MRKKNIAAWQKQYDFIRQVNIELNILYIDEREELYLRPCLVSIFCKIDIVALLFVFDKYCSIMD
jgi:hypothetical protein